MKEPVPCHGVQPSLVLLPVLLSLQVGSRGQAMKEAVTLLWRGHLKATSPSQQPVLDSM